MSDITKAKSKGFVHECNSDAHDCNSDIVRRLTIQQSIDLASENNERLAILIDNLGKTLDVLLGARTKPEDNVGKETAPCGQVALLDDILRHQSALIGDLFYIDQQIDASLR